MLVSILQFLNNIVKIIVQYSVPGNVFQVFKSRYQQQSTKSINIIQVRLSMGFLKACGHIDVSWDLWNQFLQLGSRKARQEQPLNHRTIAKYSDTKNKITCPQGT
jgi:hypothetical protein